MTGQALRGAAFWIAAAGLVGLGVALAEIRLNGYWALGFERNASLAARRVLADWLAFGVVLTLCWWALCMVGRPWLARLGDRLPGSLRRMALFAALALPTLALAHALRPPYKSLEAARQPEAWGAVAVGALLLVVALRPRMDAGSADPLDGARLRTWSLPWLAVGVAWLATIGGASPALRAGNPKNVLVVAIDTLRLDRTSLAGDGPAVGRTPRMAEWAARGTTFATAVSQAPWTLPAFASIVTGRYPRQHGAVSLYGRLRKRETTLAEVLREAGYATAGVVSHLFVDADHGFAQGFDHYDARASLGHHAITSQRVSDTAIGWLEAVDERPFLLFLHYFDPHYAFRDHPDLALAEGYGGWLREGLDIEELRRASDRLTPDDVGYLLDLYDEEIAWTDAQVGRVLDRLAALGLDEETAVVFVADHGEEFLERGWLGHTIHLHDELVRVPLVIVLPDEPEAKRVVGVPVETRALFATLLDYLEVRGGLLDTSPSLLPTLRGDAHTPAPVFSEVWLPDLPAGSEKRARATSVRMGTWKLVRDHDREQTRLYDLRADPAETRDVRADAPDALRPLEAWLQAFLDGMEAHGAPRYEPTPDLQQQLRALGYLGDEDR
ncbi:MAG: sulfatase [Myxococcota bacterium]